MYRRAYLFLFDLIPICIGTSYQSQPPIINAFLNPKCFTPRRVPVPNATLPCLVAIIFKDITYIPAVIISKPITYNTP
ncbi:uncharacterized protein F4817DRAFT_333211 [Daldinia loculata]|uniref:uncharacterized protein n=1 Tax=Daldinia loculata TaxID=103429 RepID=UPI0020C5507A|nr:uncharacterized protein F4817DRAFT_333211 [Daldinia loculata]KAI1648854.1 hypothetical protein F4817DRAFT_333211 [Daldinia loculata]